MSLEIIAFKIKSKNNLDFQQKFCYHLFRFQKIIKFETKYIKQRRYNYEIIR